MFVIDEHFWNTLFSPLGGRIASLQTLSRNKLLTNDQQHWLFFRLLYKYLRDKIIRHSVSLHLWLCRTSLGNNDDILQTSFLLQSLWYPVFAGNSSFSYLLMELLKFPFFWELRKKESLCDFHSSVGAITPSLKRPSWCFCPCRVSLRVTRRRRLSARCSSAARTSSSTPPGWSATRTTSNSIYCSAKRPPSEPPPTPPPPAPSPLPPARTSQHHSCLGPPSTQTRAGDQSVLTAGFISLKKLFETRRQSQEFNKVLETQRLFLR